MTGGNDGLIERITLYAEASRCVLVAAGLRPGMAIADFGCGVGLTTRMLAELTGPRGTVTADAISIVHYGSAARKIAASTAP